MPEAPLAWVFLGRDWCSVFTQGPAQVGKPVCILKWSLLCLLHLGLPWRVSPEAWLGAGYIFHCLIPPWRKLALCYLGLPFPGKGAFLPLPPAMWAPTSALCTARIQLGPAQP